MSGKNGRDSTLYTEPDVLPCVVQQAARPVVPGTGVTVRPLQGNDRKQTGQFSAFPLGVRLNYVAYSRWESCWSLAKKNLVHYVSATDSRDSSGIMKVPDTPLQLESFTNRAVIIDCCSTQPSNRENASLDIYIIWNISMLLEKGQWF